MSSGKWLQQVLYKQGIRLTERQVEQFSIYYHRLIEANQRMNLTAIVEEQEVYIKHFYDSLTIAFHMNMEEQQSLIDIGTGAGFPGIPLKIAFPHLRLVLLDSLQKRVTFLQEIGEELEISDVAYIHGRAEEWGQKKAYRERFDLVTARAVARLPVLLEYGLPFARKGGYFIAMKGQTVDGEMEEAETARERLGKASLIRHQEELPQGMGQRNLLLLQKHDHTPTIYPRRPGMPKKEPIS